MANITCSNCGTEFDSKAKKCPACGKKNYLKICPVCGGQMARNAKRCPKCGAKNRKPFYKRLWFWLLIFFFAFRIFGILKTEIGEMLEPSQKSDFAIKENAASENPEVLEESNTSSDASSKDIIVGTWEICKIAEKQNPSEVSQVDEASVRFQFNEDGSGTIYFLEDGFNVPITWIFGADNDGYRMYILGDGSGETTNIMWIPSDAQETDFRNLLYYQTDERVAFFKKIF